MARTEVPEPLANPAKTAPQLLQSDPSQSLASSALQVHQAHAVQWDPKVHPAPKDHQRNVPTTARKAKKAKLDQLDPEDVQGEKEARDRSAHPAKMSSSPDRLDPLVQLDPLDPQDQRDNLVRTLALRMESLDQREMQELRALPERKDPPVRRVQRVQQVRTAAAITAPSHVFLLATKLLVRDGGQDETADTNSNLIHRPNSCLHPIIVAAILSMTICKLNWARARE